MPFGYHLPCKWFRGHKVLRYSLTSLNKEYCFIIIHPFWDCSVEEDGTINVEENWLGDKIFEISQHFGEETKYIINKRSLSSGEPAKNKQH